MIHNKVPSSGVSRWSYFFTRYIF